MIQVLRAVAGPALNVATRIPGASVPSRSVHRGAMMLFGRAGFVSVGQVTHTMSKTLLPPTTT